MSYQIYICEGNLTADPELRYVGETPKCTFSVAINQRYGDKEETFFVDVEAWDKLADTVAEYKRKGDEVLVQGRWKMDEYEDKNNNKRRKYFVRADTVRFVGGKRDDDREERPRRSSRDDDRPRRSRDDDRPRRSPEPRERSSRDYDDLPF